MGLLMSFLSFFLDTKTELDKKIKFYNWSSANSQMKKPSSVEFGICFDNGSVSWITSRTAFDDSERDFLYSNYKEVSTWVEIICPAVEASLRFQYYKNGSEESLYYGPYIALNKSYYPVKCCNLQQYDLLLSWFCYNKPALIRYSAFHYNQNNKSMLPQSNIVRLAEGDQKVLFHTKCWLFAENMDWMMGSVKGISGQFTPDDVANWMLYGWTLI